MRAAAIAVLLLLSGCALRIEVERLDRSVSRAEVAEALKQRDAALKGLASQISALKDKK